MKKAIQTLGFLALISLAAIAGRAYVTAEDAALNSAPVASYMSQGFTVDQVMPSQYHYLVQPTGTYTWGTIAVDMHGKTGGLNSLETTYAKVVCYIQATEKNGVIRYRVTNSEVTENVVF